MKKMMVAVLGLTMMVTAAEAAVTKVEFYRDNNVLIGTDTAAPYSLPLDTSTLPAGSHTFYAKAHDDAGLTSTSAISTVTVNSTSGPLPGTALWAGELGGSDPLGDTTIANALVTDPNGNVIVAGRYDGTVVESGIEIRSVEGRMDVFVAKYTSSGQLLWLKSIGGTSDDYGTAVALDSQGNIYVTGYFSGSMTVGGTTLTSAGGSDIFMVKMDANGIPVPGMARRYGGAGSDQGADLKIWKDTSGEYLILGARYSNSMTVEGVSVTTAGSTDFIIGKFMISGGGFSPIWVKSFGNAASDKLVQLAIDGSGNILAITEFAGVVNYGRGDHVSAGGNDVGVIKLDPSGTVQMSKSFGGVPTEYAYSIAADRDGDFAMSLSFYEGITIESSTFTNTGGADGLVAVFNASGQLIWVRTTNSGLPNADVIDGVSFDGQGNILIGVSQYNPLTLGGPYVSSTGNYNPMAVKYDPLGKFLWQRQFKGSGVKKPTAIAVASDNDLLMVGYFDMDVIFDNYHFYAPSKYDSFVVKIKAS